MNNSPSITDKLPPQKKSTVWKKFRVESQLSSKDSFETERQDFVCLPRLPAILTDFQTGWLLGFPAEAVGVLVRCGLLVALGGAGPNDAKRFSRAYILNVAQNREWLDAATNAIYQSRPQVPSKKEITPITK